MSCKLIIALVVCVGIAAAGWYFFDLFGNGNGLRLPGVVEIQEVRLGSKVGGRVAKVLAIEGTDVYPGVQLVIFEVPELETQRDQLKARMQSVQAELDRALSGSRLEDIKIAEAAALAAKARYDRMEYGWREEEKQQAKSDLDSANADYTQAKEEFDRIRDLYRNRSASRAEHDLALGIQERTKGRYQSAKAKVDMMKAGNRQEDKDEAKAEWQKTEASAGMARKGRDEEIQLLRAKLAETQAKLAETEVSLKEANVVVPAELGKARVEVVAVRPGDIVPPNQPVVRVLRVEDLWVKVFVPETQIGKVEVGAPVDVTIDSYPDKIFKGVVRQRASISEFTPRNVQSVDERRFQMFGVKIRVDDPQGVFNAGMAAQVVFRTNNAR